MDRPGCVWFLSSVLLYLGAGWLPTQAQAQAQAQAQQTNYTRSEPPLARTNNNNEANHAVYLYTVVL